MDLKRKLKLNYCSDFGICGSDESCSSSSTCSKTDDDDGNSPREIIVSEMLVIMNNVAIIAVALVKKFPADLDDIKLS